MANLLDKASILLTPTAYDNGSMLSVKPTDGDGDFTFSRNSAATRVNAQGLVENVQILSGDLVQNGSFSEIGTEEVTNGSFSNGSTNWTLETGWSIGDDKAISDGSGSIPNTDLIQGNVFTTGKSYKVTLEIKDYVSGILQLQNNTTNFPQSNGIHTIYSSEGSASLILRSLSFIGSITNISVKEVGQDWNIEDTWTIGNSVANGNGANGSSEEIIQTSVLVVGKEYKATYQVLNYASGSVALWKGSGVALIQRTANNTYTEYFTGASNQIRFRGTNFIGSITNIVIKEVTNDTNLPRINYEGFSYQDSFGSELVTNGDFATNSYWQLGSGSSISGGSLNIISAPYNAATRQALSLTSGKTYKIVINAIAVGSATSNTFQLGFGTIGGNPSSNTQYEFEEGASVKTLTVTASATDAAVLFRARDASTSNLSINNVSVKEYLGQEVVPDSGCGSWLLEDESTNLVPYSEDFSQWSNVSTTLTSGYLAPDGTLGATKISGTIGTSNIVLGGSSSTTATRTIYARTVSGTGTAKLMSFHQNTNNLFTLTEEWQRFELNGAISTGGTSSYIDFRDNSQTLSEFIIWGAQSEELTYATSYIPTSGATSTRLRDIASGSGNSTLINSTEGVLYAEIAALADDGSYRYISISDGTNSNYIVIRYYNITSKISAFLVNSSSTQGSTSFVSGDITSFTKVAYKWKVNDFALWVDGVEVSTQSSGSVFSGETLNSLAFTEGDGVGNYFYGKNKALAVYKEALTDAELTALTTI